MNHGETVIKGSTHGVSSDLEKVILAIDAEINKMVQTSSIDFPLVALRGLARYTHILFDRLVAHQPQPIEYTAVSARNLFECYLLVSYISSDPTKAKEFISQKAYEDLEINEGFLSLQTPTTSAAALEYIQGRKKFIQELMASNGLSPSRSWKVSDLAKKTNNELEYKAFFKLHSKYVHPSSWIVNSFKEEYDNPVFRNIFILQGQHYASCTTKLISKYLDEQNTPSC